MKEWHKADEEQKRQNVARQLEFKEEKMVWEAAKKKMVAQKKCFRVPAPKFGQLPGPYPKPVQAVPLGKSKDEGDNGSNYNEGSDDDE